MTEGTHFLNVDLDLSSRWDLQPLLTALGQKVVVLHAEFDGKTYSAHLELSRITRSADATIRGFCALIQKLPAAPRARWNSARTRDFNIGVQAATTPHAFELPIEAKTLQAIAAVGARVLVTVYAARSPLPGRRDLKPDNLLFSRLPPRVPLELRSKLRPLSRVPCRVIQVTT